MSPIDTMRSVASRAHVVTCLRWPTLLAIALCRRFRRDSSQPVRSILLVRLDGLGDCVLTLPLVEALGQCLPQARLTVVTTPSAAPLFAAFSCVHETVAMPLPFSPRVPKYLRSLAAVLLVFLRRLRRERFDAVLMPRWDADIYHATLLCTLTRAGIMVGYSDHTSDDKLALNRGFDAAWTTVLPPGPLRHEVLRNLEAARALGCETPEASLHLPVRETLRERARAWMGNSSRGFLGVGLSSAEAKKRWPAAHYSAALRALHQETGLTPLLFADDDSAAAAAAIQQAVPGARLAQAMPLMQVAAMLAECRVFLGNDSGLGHMAAAVGCPTVTIFSQAADSVGEHLSRHSTSPQRFRPFGPRTAFLQPDTGRPGCHGGCRALEAHCIADVPPERAVAAVLTLLRSSTSYHDAEPAR